MAGHVLNGASVVVVHALEVQIRIEAVLESCPESIEYQLSSPLFSSLSLLFSPSFL